MSDDFDGITEEDIQAAIKWVSDDAEEITQGIHALGDGKPATELYLASQGISSLNMKVFAEYIAQGAMRQVDHELGNIDDDDDEGFMRIMNIAFKVGAVLAFSHGHLNGRRLLIKEHT